MKSYFRICGFGLVLLALVGFLTVADDWRHTGELLGVGSILLAGITLAAAGWESRLSQQLALPAFAVAVGVGAVAGAAIDDMPVGVGAGAVLRLWLAFRFGTPPQAAARRGD